MVGRGPVGEVTAYSAVVRLAELDRHLTQSDPAVAAVLQHLQAHPLLPTNEALLHRRALGRRRGERPSPEVGAMVVDLKRLYLQLRPQLARVYAVVGDWDAVAPAMRVMGFGRAAPEIHIGATTFHVCVLDFGAGSVDGWLAQHVFVESGSTSVADPQDGGISLLPPAERPPVARLSAREREVLAALADGLTNMELAERLFISERTANRHLSNIFTKLGVRNRTSAARIAIEAGLAG